MGNFSAGSEDGRIIEPRKVLGLPEISSLTLLKKGPIRSSGSAPWPAKFEISPKMETSSCSLPNQFQSLIRTVFLLLGVSSNSVLYHEHPSRLWLHLLLSLAGNSNGTSLLPLLFQAEQDFAPQPFIIHTPCISWWPSASVFQSPSCTWEHKIGHRFQMWSQKCQIMGNHCLPWPAGNLCWHSPACGCPTGCTLAWGYSIHIYYCWPLCQPISPACQQGPCECQACLPHIWLLWIVTQYLFSMQWITAFI